MTDLELLKTAVACATSIDDAVTSITGLLKDHGYKVSKPRAPKQEPRKLNAIGKPYGPGFDPKYRMRYRTPSISNQQGNTCDRFMPTRGESAKANWQRICMLAEIDAIRHGLVDPAKARFNPPAVVAMLVPSEQSPEIAF